MIQLHRDCLLLRTPSGDFIPCFPELFSIQLVESSGSVIEAHLVRQAAAAVLHHFKHDLGRQSITVAEFSIALEKVLRSIGLMPKAAPDTNPENVTVTDLRSLLGSSPNGFELAFFLQLREELKTRLTTAPKILRFRGLRNCVKELLRAKRWNRRCQALHDQIVDYLRDCLETEAPSKSCGLVVS